MKGISQSALRVLVVDDELQGQTARGRATRAIIAVLEARGCEAVEAQTIDDGISVLVSDPSLDCVLLDWDLDAADGTHRAEALIDHVCETNWDLPIFLLADRTQLESIPVEIVRKVDDYIWVLQDTPSFIAGRVENAARRYRATLLPPFFGALVRFSEDHEYSWHTPGHSGGTAFLKSPVGRAFHAFFGEPLFRSDLSISVPELGSLLDHSGPIGEAERHAAKVFGADTTWFVTNGTSTSNKIVFFASVTEGDVVLVDRNCHKSIIHALQMTGSTPVYLTPTRNRYGMLGPIPPADLEASAIRAAIGASTLGAAPDARPVHAVITNSTYDGLCFDLRRATALLGASVDRVHYDEAWYGYGRFHPLYAGRHAMLDDLGPDAPTIFATQSTHKMLAALSQASYIHVRDGRAAIEPARFNEAFMMHASTSPSYALIASDDVAAQMMKGTGGRTLVDQAIDEAVSFRKFMARIGREVETAGDWWFGVWQPREVVAADGRRMRFADAPDRLLRSDPSCWLLRDGEAWHGFDAIEDGWCMLDPVKVTVVTPGIGDDGHPEPFGVPAPIVDRYLQSRGIVCEKVGEYTLLLLFSLGVTKGKWGTIITELFEFKRRYEANQPLDELFPELVLKNRARYKGVGLRDLCDEMHEVLSERDGSALLNAAFGDLPPARISAAAAYRALVHDEVDAVALDDLAGRVVAVGVMPYPPGIPVLMPGEEVGPEDGPILRYLRALAEFDRRFPGFGHDVHGVHDRDGEASVYCVRG